jgi:hypothetical protein
VYDRHNVVLAHGEAWSQSDIEAFADGLSALPESLRDESEQPLRVRRVPTACPRGIGDDTAACPRFDASGRTFFLYDFEQDSTDQKLWRQRAAVHMIVSVLDRKHRWSTNAAWTSINGWDDDRALNVAHAGYMRPLGRRSSHLDLVTFTEAFFAPTQTSAGPNRDIRCREFTRAHFVVEHILEQDPGIEDAGTLAWLPEGGCPAFDAWARIDTLDRVELLLATATSDRPESLYGHLLLHLRYSPGDRVDAHGFDPVFQFGAVTDTEVESLTYVIKGIFGGFPSVMTSHTFREIARMIMLREGRSLSRFELELTATQRIRLLHRLREVQRRDKLDYKFFKRNCASFLIYALSPVFDGRIDPRMSGIFAMPTDVLDVLAGTTYDGASILKKSGADYRSHRQRTRRAASQRRDSLDRLLESLDTDDAHARQLLEIDSRLDADHPEDRAKAYSTLREQLVNELTRWKLSSDDPAHQQRVERLLVDYTYMVTTSERYFSQIIYMRERMAAEQYAALEYPLTADEQLDRRDELQRIEDHERREQLMNKWAAEQSRRMQRAHAAIRADRDPARVRAEQAQQAAYLGALELQATLMQLFSADFDAVSHLARREVRRDRAAAERARRARPDSGRNRVLLRADIQPTDSTERAIRAGVTYALISDKLGEIRQRGFRANLESEALVLDAVFDTSQRVERAFAGALKLFRYRDLTREPRLLRDSFLDALGWGTDVRLYHHGARGQLFGGRANVGYIAPIVSGAGNPNLLAFGIFPEGNAYLGSGQQILLGGRAVLRARLHLAGAYANALRLRAESAHYLGLGTIDWRHESAAQLAVDMAVQVGGGQPMVVSPFARVGWQQVTPDDPARPGMRAGLQVELPW